VAAVIFGPDYVKALKPGIKLGENAVIYSGSADPAVDGFSGNPGDVYISTSQKKMYQKQDAGFSTDWGEMASTTPVSKYKLVFNSSSDWTLSSGFYEITILGTTHGKGNDPVVQVFETSGGASTEVKCVITVTDSNGDVFLQVTGTPDNRFAGKVLIE
jgi:hypothetical protein